MTTLLGAFFAALLGLAVLFGLFLILIVPLIGPSYSWRPRFVLQLRRRDLARVEKLLKRGEGSLAAALIQRTFYLPQHCVDQNFVERVSSHNTNTLNALINITERCYPSNGSLSNIEERLLRHAELFSELTEVLKSQQNLKSRRSQRGRETPGWASSEFTRQQKNLRENIAANASAFAQELKKYLSTTAAKDTSTPTYH